MKPYEIADRLNLLYGNSRPMLSELERIVNTEELSSVFTLSSYFLGKKHRANMNALMNLVYERQVCDNTFVLFKVLDKISQDKDSLDALRNFMACETIDRKSMYLVFRVLNGMYPNETDALDDLKNIVCAEDGEFDRDLIFLLFNILEKLIDDEEGLGALKNVCGNHNFIKSQTELLFRVIMNIEYPDDEILSALKNIIAVDTGPDLFLLFKVIQGFDESNEEISQVKSATIFKTKIFELAHTITEGKYTIPMNMKKMINRFEGDALTDAFSRGQLQSKLWLTDIVNNYEIDLGKTIYTCAGWYGVLPALLFERCKIEGNIYSFDIDPSTDNPADTLNKEYIIDQMKFKAFVKDVADLKFSEETLPIKHYKYSDAVKFEVMNTTHTIGQPTCVINTSCEHIAEFDKWWNAIPKGTLVILQNNDFIEHDDETVVNTKTDVDSWAKELNMSKELFRGTLALEYYNRYMIIGEK